MSFVIKVVRGKSSGTLSFAHGKVKVSTTCWWDPKVRVDAGTYKGYATRMTTKTDGSDGGNREGIWFGPKVPLNKGTRSSDEIFVHKGKNADWSDGCIVCAESEVLKIWTTINPKETRNVSIEIEDT